MTFKLPKRMARTRYRLTNHGFLGPTDQEHQWFVDLTHARAAASQQHLWYWTIYEYKMDGSQRLVEIERHMPVGWDRLEDRFGRPGERGAS